MENVFRNQLVSKNQSLRGKELANSLPGNDHMSQYLLSKLRRSTVPQRVNCKVRVITKRHETLLQRKNLDREVIEKKYCGRCLGPDK
jgi:hypothetical protein